MKTIALLIGILCLFAVNQSKGQKDSIIVESGVLDKKDSKRMAKNLKSQIENGNLENALASAKILGKNLKSKDLERIIKTNIKEGRAKTAYKAAGINGRKLKFEEVFKSLWKKELPFDSVSNYWQEISAKEAYKLQKFYITRGDLFSSESCSKISGEKIKDSEFIKISKLYFQKREIDMVIVSAKKAGNLGREELGKLLRIYTNLRDLDTSIKIAAAIGGKNLTLREWVALKRMIPPANLEDITDFINEGSLPKVR